MKKKSTNRRRRIKKQKPAQKNAQHENFFEARVQRKCEKCEDEDKKGVQKKDNGQKASGSKNFFSHYMNNIHAKGVALSPGNRNFFESRMNDNFGEVKIHNDKEAANAAKEIGAKAFTWENHIVVNQQYFEEGSIKAKQLLAHELKHVQQQKNGRKVIQMMSEETISEPTEEGVNQMPATDNASMEKEAEKEEDRVMIPESLPDFQTFGKPFTKTAFANSVSFEGETYATFNGGIGSTRNLTRAPADDCVGCTENDCFRYSGQLKIDYSVSTSVTLPDVPEGLTECQHQRVRNAIDNVLAPHEQDHVDAFNQYNGSVSLPISYTGCSAGFQEYVQDLHNANASARRTSVQATSDALDPFHIAVDMDCEDESATVPEPGTTE